MALCGLSSGYLIGARIDYLPLLRILGKACPTFSPPPNTSFSTFVSFDTLACPIDFSSRCRGAKSCKVLGMKLFIVAVFFALHAETSCRLIQNSRHTADVTFFPTTIHPRLIKASSSISGGASATSSSRIIFFILYFHLTRSNHSPQFAEQLSPQTEHPFPFLPTTWSPTLFSRHLEARTAENRLKVKLMLHFRRSNQSRERACL